MCPILFLPMYELFGKDLRNGVREKAGPCLSPQIAWNESANAPNFSLLEIRFVGLDAGTRKETSKK